jgi:hypothetical protein
MAEAGRRELVVVVVVVVADGAGERREGEEEEEEVDGFAMLRSRQSPFALLLLLVAAVIMGRRGVFWAWETRDSTGLGLGLGRVLGTDVVLVSAVDLLPREGQLGRVLVLVLLFVLLAPDCRCGCEIGALAERRCWCSLSWSWWFDDGRGSAVFSAWRGPRRCALLLSCLLVLF